MSVITPSDDVVVGLCCERLPSDTGWTWTLVTRLGAMLTEIEDRYGPRDSVWTPLGIEFGGPRPRIWYPGDVKQLSIGLSANARLEPERAIFQLAHEAIHLLAPTGKPDAPAVEEGLAVLYSLEVLERFSASFHYDSPDYIHCKLLTEQFLHQCGGHEAVKAIRQKEPAFNRWTPGLLSETYAQLSEQLAADLCEPFSSVTKRLVT